MLNIDKGNVVYIGEAYEYVDTKWGRRSTLLPNGLVGWFKTEAAGLFVSLETGNHYWPDDIDFDKSMGRCLQPNESILVRYTSQ